MGCSHSNWVIIGAGAAGLSTAYRLIEYGIQPTIIDAGTFPSHKVCGEFFSPECLPLLDRWNLLPEVAIKEASFTINARTVAFSLPEEARSESHYTFDLRFLDALRKKGAIIKTGTRVERIDDDHIALDTGEEIPYKNLFLGTGRTSGASAPFVYTGMKTELARKSENCLQMHIVPGGYYGISPVSERALNVAYLSKGDCPQAPFEGDWMRVKVPEFGVSTHASKPHFFPIGDAMARIPPCSGDGLAMAITGGVLAADFAVQDKWKVYQSEWRKRYQKRIQWAIWIHRMMMRPKLASAILGTFNYFPFGFQFLYRKMRANYTEPASRFGLRQI